MYNHVELWNKCLDIMKYDVSDAMYNTWLSPLVPYSYVDNKLTLQVPSPFFVEYIEANLSNILYTSLQKVFGPEVQLYYKEVVLNNDLHPTTTTLTSARPQLPAQQEKNQVTKRNPFANTSYPPLENSNLNTTYNLDSYIEGTTNRLARTAGINIAANPGTSLFNPMFIYGDSAVGKTHLANAIGLAAKQRFPDKRVLYISANLFQQQFASATINNTTNDFLLFYQSLDFLIVDDIQDFCGTTKAKTQNTFFHIFEHLHRLGKQLILCSDREPAKLQGVEDRILSRFKWGLTVKIERPDYTLRHDIVRYRVEKNGLNIPEDVIEFIARNVTTNIRDIEGILISLLARSTYTEADINLDLAKQVVGDIIEPSAKTNATISIERICDVVCRYYAMPIEDINSKSRKQGISEARQVAMYLARNHTDSPLSTIGETIGKRNYATVIHACKTIRDQMDVDTQLSRRIHEIEDILHK